MESLIATLRRSYTAAVDFLASPDFSVPDTDCALQVYRIVQEALNNALKHSESDRVEVRLFRDHPSDTLIAEVTDYGRGIPATLSGEGMGLRIMRYRAEKAGVDLRIEPLSSAHAGGRPSGTRVSCRIKRTPVGTRR